MEVDHKEGGATEFITRPLWEAERQTPALLEPNAARSDAWLRVCSWCEKVWIGEAWAEVEEAVTRWRLFEQSLMPLMTHGVCEQCHQKMKKALAER